MDACREEATSLFAMGFTRRAVGAAGTAPDARAPAATWHDRDVEASTSGRIAPSTAGLEPHIMASNSLENPPSTAGQEPHILASNSLGSALHRRMWQPSILQDASVSVIVAIIESNRATRSIYF
jgi:hypothetical protein